MKEAYCYTLDGNGLPVSVSGCEGLANVPCQERRYRYHLIDSITYKGVIMKNYGVLKGKAVHYKRDNDSDPHSELLMNVDGVKFRIAINVRSSRGPVNKRLIEYLIKPDIRHPVIDHARNLPSGWNNLKDGVNDDAAIDYIRE